MSLLEIVQDAMTLAGLTPPDVVYSSSDTTVAQFRALAQVEGEELSRYHDWRNMKVTLNFTGDGVSTLYALPADFDRFHAGVTFWPSTNPQWPLEGPLTDEEWLALRARTAQPTRPVWRFYGDMLEFYPAVSTGEIYQTEYRSSCWITDPEQTLRRDRWGADSDRAIIPERIVRLGLIWRWKKSKGFDYAEDFRTYQVERAKAAMSDGGKAVIRLGDGPADTRRRPGRNDVRVIV